MMSCRKALTERGRPRPRERLPKERSSKGWMKRSGTLAEPSDNYTAAFINGSSTTIRGISSLPGSVASRLVIFLVTILAFRISIRVSHEQLKFYIFAGNLLRHLSFAFAKLELRHPVCRSLTYVRRFDLSLNFHHEI